MTLETLDLRHDIIKPLYWSGINVLMQQIRVNSFIEDKYKRVMTPSDISCKIKNDWKKSFNEIVELN